jgi:hypothetical protein
LHPETESRFSKPHYIENIIFGQKEEKKEEEDRQYEAKGNLKSGNGVGGDGGVCAAHVGRGIHVVKRSCYNKGLATILHST